MWGENHFFLSGEHITEYIRQFFELINNPDRTKSLKIFNDRYQNAPKAKNSSLNFLDMLTLLYSDYRNGTDISTHKYNKLRIVAARLEAMNVNGKKTMLPVDILNHMILMWDIETEN